MPVSRDDVLDGVVKYWVGADNDEWVGAEFKRQLAQLGLTMDTSKITSHGDLERRLFGPVHKDVVAKGYMEPAAVLLVTSWKSDRALPCVGMNERVSGTLAHQTNAAFAAGLTGRDRISALSKIHGVAEGVASALLTVFRPEEFSVADWRALQALRAHDESAGEVPFSKYKDGWWLRHYDLYVDGCIAIAEREEVSLRDLDRFLWRWSADQGSGTSTNEDGDGDQA